MWICLLSNLRFLSYGVHHNSGIGCCQFQLQPRWLTLYSLTFKESLICFNFLNVGLQQRTSTTTSRQKQQKQAFDCQIQVCWFIEWMGSPSRNIFSGFSCCQVWWRNGCQIWVHRGRGCSFLWYKKMRETNCEPNLKAICTLSKMLIVNYVLSFIEIFPISMTYYWRGTPFFIVLFCRKIGYVFTRGGYVELSKKLSLPLGSTLDRYEVRI